MDVEDAAGEQVGKVIYARLCDPTAIDEMPSVASIPSEIFAVAAGAHREPNAAAALSAMLLQNDYFKFNAQRRRRWDEHYYAMTEDIAIIDADTVRLSRPLGELLTPYT